MKKYKSISEHEFLSSICILLVSFLSGIRGWEWIVTDDTHLEKVSKLYLKMQEIADIQTFGWFLLASSLLLFISVFIKSSDTYIFYIIGGFIGAVTHYLYALASVDAANLFTTYYHALIIAFVQVLIMMIGIYGLWKKR